MSQKILIKRGLKANLPTLSIGEFAWCTDTKELFIGTDTGNVMIYPVNGSGGSITVTDSTTNGYIRVNGVEIQIYDDTNKADKTHTHAELHTHSNKTQLDKVGENGQGQLTYNGSLITGGTTGGAAINDASTTSTTDTWSANKSNTELAKKANLTHTHPISDITNLQTTLNGKASSVHTHTLSDITDIDSTTNKTNGNVLTYDSTAGKTVFKPVPTVSGSGATNLDGLTDVDVTTTTPVEGNVLKYQSGLWKPGVGSSGSSVPPVFVSITSNGVVAGSTTDQSAGIQAILNANKFVYFPAGTYYCFNLRPQEGSVWLFDYKCILKFPAAASSTTGGNRQMVLVGFTADRPAGQEFDGFRTIGHVTIDASLCTQSGTELEGFFILGAKNFHIDGVTGIAFPNGYPVWAGVPYSADKTIKLAENHNGVIKNVSSLQSSWGAVAIVGGRNIIVENTYAEGGIYVNADSSIYPAAAVVIEPWHDNPNEVENITVRNVEFKQGTKGIALIVDAHNRKIRNVKVEGILGHIKLSLDPAAGGLIDNLTLENIEIDGASTSIPQGLSLIKNNAHITNLHVKNGTIKNCSAEGTYCSGGQWDNVLVTNCGKSGFNGNYTATNTDNVEAVFSRCRSIDNNTTNAANESGWRFSLTKKLTLINCRATDTRTTKLQNYGVFASGVELDLINNDLVGNKTARYFFTNGQSAPVKETAMMYYQDTAPTGANKGDEWYDSVNNTKKYWNNTAWV